MDPGPILFRTGCYLVRMKKQIIALVAAWGLSVPVSNAQVLLSDSLLLTFTVQELIDNGVGNATYPIEVHKLVYATTDPFGAATIASGAVVLPISQGCFHAMATYMHGTILHREEVPSRLSSEALVGYYLGGTGYVGVMPDYLGLGDSPGPHPYIHSATEASASIDLLRATREFCAAKDVLLNGQLFLTGYSQGGHACMATHKAIQELFPDEFQVTASAPCSGPYDVSGVQAGPMVSPDPYPAPYYLPYVVFSMGYVNPGLYNNINEVFKEPWATQLPPLFLGNNGSAAVDAIMPAAPSEILHDSVLQAFIADPDHYFRVALRDNDLYDWRPDDPVHMIYCESDSHVFYENSIVAFDAMQALGAPAVTAASAGAGFDHGDCAFPALLTAKAVFDALQGPCDWNGIDERHQMTWSAYPNPARDQIRLLASDGLAHATNWALHSTDGRMVANGNLRAVHGEALVNLPEVSQGLYMLRLSGDGADTSIRIVVE